MVEPGTRAAETTAAATATADTGRGGAEGRARPSSAATAATGPVGTLDGLRFGIEKSMRYHRRRAGAYQRAHKATMFLAILAGASAVAPWGGAGLGLLAAALSAFDLVWSPSVRACDHDRLHRDFARLLNRIDLAPRHGPAELVAWEAERRELENDEPPIYWAVEADCWNDVARAWGRDGKIALNDIPWGARALKHVVRFEGRHFGPKPEPA